MVKKVGKFLKGVGGKKKSGEAEAGRGRAAGRSSSGSGSGDDRMRILKKGHAMRVIFFYPGEEGTYVDNADVTLFENGVIHIQSNQEETTTHLQNCEILWRFEVESEDRANKLRLLKPKSESRATAADPEGAPEDPEADEEEDGEEASDETLESVESLESHSRRGDGKSSKGPGKNPELR